VVAASSCVGAGDRRLSRMPMGSAPPSPLHAVEVLLRSGRLDSPGRQDHPAADILIETTDVGFVSFSAQTTRVKPDSAGSLLMPVLTAAGQLRESGRRPRRSSTTPPTWSSRPCPLSSESQLAHPQPVGSWDTCVGIRQLCDAQFELSMEDADRMTPSRAFVEDPPVDASVTAAYEDDLASDGNINNSTRVGAGVPMCWRPSRPFVPV
jgi:hypothetical protein